LFLRDSVDCSTNFPIGSKRADRNHMASRPLRQLSQQQLGERADCNSPCDSRAEGAQNIARFLNVTSKLLPCADADAEQRMKGEVDKVLRTGDSVGGVFEVVAHGVPPGLGSYAQWDERLDGLLAAAVHVMQA